MDAGINKQISTSNTQTHHVPTRLQQYIKKKIAEAIITHIHMLYCVVGGDDGFPFEQQKPVL